MKKIAIVLVSILFLGLNAGFALEDITVSTLPSGQKVVIKEVHDNPIVKIDTWINTGSINENDSNTGLSHFLEHLFFKGTKQNPKGEFDKILEAKGANVNAATSKDFTHYYVEIPSKDFELALKLHSDMLLNPEIPEDELENERGVVIEEISKTLDSPSNRVFDNIYKLLYTKSNHPYKRNVIGKREVIETVSRDEILNYFKRFYTPDAYTTIIVGDVNTKDALKMTQEAFKRPAGKQEKVKYPHVLKLNKTAESVEYMDINKTHFMMAYLAPKFTDYKDNYALDVLAEILGSGKSSILNQELKEKRKLVLSISSGNYSQKTSGMFYIYFTSDPENEKEARDSVLDIISKIQKGEIEDSILGKAKNQIKTDTLYSRESISNIADDLGYVLTFTGNTDYYDNYLKNIDKVTKEDIVRVAKKYLDINNYAASSVRPKDAQTIGIADRKDPFKQVVPEPKSKLLEEKSGVSKYLLENGASLIFKKKTLNSIVAFDISIKGSKAIEKKPTTALLAAACAMEGTENFSAADFAKYLDEKGIKLGVSSSNDVFSISMQTTTDNLPYALIALDEVLNKPVFLESEIEKIKQRKIKELKAISDSPSAYVFDEFKRLAYKDTIYGQNSTFVLENIEKPSRDDIKEFYQTVINPENMTIAVVGDVDCRYIQNKLNEIIKPKKEGEKEKFQYSKQKFRAYKPEDNIETKLFKNEVQANWMALGYKTTGLLNRKDIAVLNVLNSILGSGMSSRLFVELREKKGLAYTVGSSLSSNVLDGAFIAYIGTNAKSIDEARRGLEGEIEKIKKEAVTDEELQNAKDKIMGKLLLALETNMDEAQLYTLYGTLGLGLEGFEEYKKMISETTKEDILNVANKYFNSPFIYTVVLQK